MNHDINDRTLNLVCPLCKENLHIVTDDIFSCQHCQIQFKSRSGIPDFMPPADELSLKCWDTWKKLQDNSMVIYQNDPLNNLAVGDRIESVRFRDFCQLAGNVLDVGCGPQALPAYLIGYPEDLIHGIDPYEPLEVPRFNRVIGLGEFLPYPSKTFDRVLYATSLDHFIDPIKTLTEAARVCNRTGRVMLWTGERIVPRERNKVSPDWYTRLTVPEGADDLFHFKKFGPEDMRNLILDSPLEIWREEVWTDNGYRHVFIEAGIRE